MTPSANSGPGRAQAKGKSASGRTTAKGTRSGGSRVGRYTPPVPKSVRRSPRWVGGLILGLLLLGVLVIILNYSNVLPGGVSVWYLVAGLVMIFVGFLMATRYR